MDVKSISVGQIKENCGFRESCNCETVLPKCVCFMSVCTKTHTQKNMSVYFLWASGDRVKG